MNAPRATVGRTIAQTVAAMHAELTVERAAAEARLTAAKAVVLSKPAPSLAEYETWQIARQELDAIADAIYLLETEQIAS